MEFNKLVKGLPHRVARQAQSAGRVFFSLITVRFFRTPVVPMKPSRKVQRGFSVHPDWSDGSGQRSDSTRGNDSCREHWCSRACHEKHGFEESYVGFFNRLWPRDRRLCQVFRGVRNRGKGQVPTRISLQHWTRPSWLWGRRDDSVVNG
jgi:hypothetical protein